MFFAHDECGFSSMGICTILGNQYGIKGQNYVALLNGSEMSASFHCRNFVLGL